ncbi:cyclophilin-like fold protein [Streptomyces sp. NPDC057099]|uniref:cyclophilin-like fold protein n=1 Tax=Streptomyces sp. NPDC057099 TaxID=3346019 RepID=UPI0036286A59
MTPAALARAVPAAALLLALTACAQDTREPAGPASPAPRRRTATGPAPTPPTGRTTTVNIRLTLDGHPVDATLNDGTAARDFAALLPLTLDLSDFHGTERIADLPRRLDTSGAPDAARARAGDLAYYAPWGNLALYYRDGGSSDSGLVVLGHLADGATERLATAEHITVEAAA